jgi:PAS domain-containing protein
MDKEKTLERSDRLPTLREEDALPAEVLDAGRALAVPGSEGASEHLLGELEAIFLNAPIAMILVDRERQVLRLNLAAGRLTGLPPAEMIGQVAGVALCCENSTDVEEGCGFGPRCPGCPLRQLVERSFETRRPIPAVEATTRFAISGTLRDRRLRISSSFMEIRRQARTLVCIEDLTDRSLPEGGTRSLVSSPDH